MAKRRAQFDYQPVVRSRPKRAVADEHAIAQDWPAKVESSRKADLNKTQTSQGVGFSDAKRFTLLKHGHTFSYAALFLFTFILYARPAELYPSRLTASMALM